MGAEEPDRGADESDMDFAQRMAEEDQGEAPGVTSPGGRVADNGREMNEGGVADSRGQEALMETPLEAPGNAPGDIPGEAPMEATPVLVPLTMTEQPNKQCVIHFSMPGLSQALNLPPFIRLVGMRVEGDSLYLKVSGAGNDPKEGLRVVSVSMHTAGFWLIEWITVDDIAKNTFPKFMVWPDAKPEEPHSF